MLKEQLTNNYEKLSLYIAKEVDKNVGWHNLVSRINERIILHCLKDIELWNQFANYSENDKAKGIIINGKVKAKGGEVSQNSENISENLNEDMNSGTSNGNQQDLNQSSKIITFNLDEQILDACLKVRYWVNENVFHCTLGPEYVPSAGKVIDFIPYISKFYSNKDHEDNSKKLKDSDEDYDYDSENSNSNPIDQPNNVEQCLIEEISKLDFNFLDENNKNNLNLVEGLYYDKSYDQNVIEEMIQILEVKESIDQKLTYLKELRKQEEKLKGNIISDSSDEEESNQKNSINDQPNSPIFNCDRGPLKYIMNLVDKNQNKLALDKPEIRSLLNEVVGDEGSNFGVRIHKNELYDAFERVIQSLIDYKEHSYPFLSPVQRKSAPDYHKVISNPMDLSTLSRRVKAKKYSTKEEFEKDLFLIYSNCRIYNTTEGNEYILHASAMEDYSKQLLNSIPDDFNKPNDLQNSRRKSLGSNLDSKKSSSSQIDTEEQQGSSLNYYGNDHSSSLNIKCKGVDELGKGIEKITEEIKKLQNKLISLEFNQGTDQDPILAKWLNLTREIRANNKLLRFALGENKFEDCPAIIQGGDNFFIPKMANSLDLELEPISDGIDKKPLGFSREDFSNRIDNKPLFKDQNIDVCKIFPELNLSGNIPTIPKFDNTPNLFNEEYIDRICENQPCLSNFKQALIPDGQYSRGLINSIAQLKCTQEVYDKIGTAEEFLGDDLAGSHNAEALRSTIQYLSSESKPDPSPFTKTLSSNGIRDDSPNLDSHTANELCLRSTALLLQSVGFDTCEDQSLQIVTEIMGKFIMNLGKTMRLYMDLHGDDMSSEEILLHALYENRISGIEDLTEYLEEEIDSQSSKLCEVREKLKDRFNTLVSRPSGTGVNEEGELDFDKGLDSFMAGNFEDITGDDFFGFKDLGLDKEIGFTSLTVPARLLLGHKRHTFMHKTNGLDDSMPLYPPPPSYSPITASTEVIGLLKGFFDEKLKDGVEEVPEDENIPRKSIKPKIPPIGRQIGALRRKMVEHAAMLAAKKEKKDKENEERNIRRKQKEAEMLVKKKIRKAEQQARAQAREEERIRRKAAKVARMEARKAEIEQKRANSKKKNATQTSPVANSSQKGEEEEDSLYASSPIHNTTSPSISASPIYSSPIISSTSSDEGDNDNTISNKNRLVRKDNPFLNTNISQKRSKGSYPISQTRQSNGNNDYAVISSTSDESDSNYNSSNLKRKSTYHGRNGNSNDRDNRR